MAKRRASGESSSAAEGHEPASDYPLLPDALAGLLERLRSRLLERLALASQHLVPIPPETEPRRTSNELGAQALSKNLHSIDALFQELGSILEGLRFDASSRGREFRVSPPVARFLEMVEDRRWNSWLAEWFDEGERPPDWSHIAPPGSASKLSEATDLLRQDLELREQARRELVEVDDPIDPPTRPEAALLMSLHTLPPGAGMQETELREEMDRRGGTTGSRSVFSGIVARLRERGWKIPTRTRVGYYLTPRDRIRYSRIREAIEEAAGGRPSDI